MVKRARILAVINMDLTNVYIHTYTDTYAHCSGLTSRLEQTLDGTWENFPAEEEEGRGGADESTSSLFLRPLSANCRILPRLALLWSLGCGATADPPIKDTPNNAKSLSMKDTRLQVLNIFLLVNNIPLDTMIGKNLCIKY